MNSKKILMIIMAVVIVAIIGVLAWKGVGNKTGSNPTVPTTENPITTDTTTGAGEQTTGGQTTGGSIGKMTDAIFIEIAAQAAYYSQKDPASWVARMEALYKKYGITEENMTAYSEALSKDPQHAAEFAQKYAQRLTELQNTGK
jgi:hypothetical protein